MSRKSKEHVCPHSSTSFIRIGNHKCKRAPKQTHDTDPCKAEEAPDSDEQVILADTGPKMNVQFQKKSSPPADGMSQCTTCTKYYKQLSKHKCKMAQSAKQHKAHGVPGDTGATGDIAQDGKSQCPSCKQYFKQLSKHKCKADIQPVDSQGARVGEEQVVRDAFVATVADEKHQYPSCNESFKQLSRHKCKTMQLAYTEKACKSEEILPNACIKDKVLQQEQYKTAADGKRQCPSCKGGFKQLSRHKCKVVQSDQHADTDEESASQEKAPAQDKTTSEVTCRISSSDKFKDEESSNATAVKAISPRRNAAANCSSSSLPLYKTVGHQPVINTGKLDAKAEQLMDDLRIDHANRPVRAGDDFFDKEVKLEQEEKRFAKSVHYPFREEIKKKLNESTYWSWEGLLTGSYADGTKVTRPDEIDIMWYPDKLSQWLEPVFANAPLGYCFVKLRKLQNDDVKYTELARLCTEDEVISSKKFRDETFKIFDKTITEDTRKASAKKDPAAKEGSPSYAVLLDTVPGRPPISIDLVPCLHLNGWPEVSHTCLPGEVAAFVTQQGYDVIPKDCKDEKYGDVKHLLWRLSFSRSEKRLTQYPDGKLRRICAVAPSTSGLHSDSFVSDDNGDVSDDLQTSEDAKPNAGSKPAAAKKKPALPPTCRKSVLRMLKRILEIIKRFDNSRSREPCPAIKSLKVVVDALYREERPDFKIDKFTTFQIRTLMWTEYYVTNPGDSLWTRENRRARLSHALAQLKKMVSGKMHVPHFFLPDLDIMADCTSREREFLYIIFAVAEKLF